MDPEGKILTLSVNYPSFCRRCMFSWLPWYKKCSYKSIRQENSKIKVGNGHYTKLAVSHSEPSPPITTTHIHTHSSLHCNDWKRFYLWHSELLSTHERNTYGIWEHWRWAEVTVHPVPVSGFLQRTWRFSCGLLCPAHLWSCRQNTLLVSWDFCPSRFSKSK
jgi:hypothetical protein